MFSFSPLVVVAVVLVTAPFSLAVSDSCLQAELALSASDFSTCADIQDFTASVLTTQFSIVEPLNIWLTGVCRQSCTESTLANATSTITTGCAADVAQGVQNAVGLQALVANYTQGRSAFFTVSTLNSTSCVTNFLQSVQNFTGSDLTWIELERLSLSSYDLPSSVLCTDYTHALNTNLAPLAPNITASLTARCGASFADGKVPGTVSVKEADQSATTHSGKVKIARGWPDWTLAVLGLMAGYFCYY